MRTSRTTRTAKTFRPKSAAELHRVWLKLVETNGPFLAIPPLKLAIPPLKEVWPQGMPALAGERLEVSKHLLNQVPATFTPADAVAAGVPRHAVYGWRDAGQIVEISRGVYRKADAPTTAYVDLIAVAKRAPRGVVCLVSALAVHELTDEIPSAVQMAVPNGVNVPRIAYPPTEFSRFDADTFDLGRIRFEAAHGEWVARCGCVTGLATRWRYGRYGHTCAAATRARPWSPNWPGNSATPVNCYGPCRWY
jgi:hypothetical protein